MKVLYFELNIDPKVGKLLNIPSFYRYLYVPEKIVCVQLEDGSISSDFGLAEIAEDILEGRGEALRYQAQVLTYDASTVEELVKIATQRN